jgi:thiamine kinase-like enzyme
MFSPNYYNTSDYRVKDNVKQLDETFTVKYLNPISYTNNKTKNKDIGLIAHELQQHFPELVTGEKDGQEFQTINYIGLIGILIKEVQELQKINSKYEEKITSLENSIKDHENRISLLEK